MSRHLCLISVHLCELFLEYRSSLVLMYACCKIADFYTLIRYGPLA